MTEATCAITLFPPTVRSESFSVGELAPNCAVKIVLDEEGKVEAPQGERGEIWAKVCVPVLSISDAITDWSRRQT